MKLPKVFYVSFIPLFSLIALAATPPVIDIFKLKGEGKTGAITVQSGVVTNVLPGASGNVLKSNGTVWTSGTVPAVTATWGSITGTLSNQTDLQNALDAKEPTITGGLTTQYWRGDKTFQLLSPAVRASLSVSAPLSYNSGTGNFNISQANSSQDGYLTASDWTTFNNKIDASRFNYITNPDADVDTAGWNLYSDAGNTTPASIVDQDITYTSALSGDSGNGATVTYALGTSPYAEPPVITCPTGTSVLVKWYNGPTISQNPTATVLKAAWDATPCAVAIASATITGTASRRQYITGTVTLVDGGDAGPVDGTGGSPTGVTFTRTTVTPIGGVADFLLSKDAASREGLGVSTDFTIQAIDKGVPLQVSFAYSGTAGMTFGTSGDLRVWVYDLTNAVLIPVTPRKTLVGPASTIKTFVGQFLSSGTSVNYRLILHVGTTNASAWDLHLHNVNVSDVLNATAATQVPSLVLQSQPINGAVTDHMVVMWRDGATSWVPATIAGAAISAFGSDKTGLGFATNIVGSTADIYVSGAMDGFSFGPFSGYNWYIDNTAGGISPLPSPFTDLYVIVGQAISSTVLNIDFRAHVDQISNSSGVPIKGGLLTSSAVNDGTGDLVLSPGANGNVVVANSAAALGLSYLPAVVAAAPFTYTLATRTLTAATATNSVAGFLSAADHTTFAAAAPLASPAFTGTPSLPTGTTGVTQTAGNSTTALATTAFVTTADNLKANLASPTFTGTPTLPTGTIGVTQTAGNSTTALATTAFVTTADNLKANLASPTFTGDVNSSTGNVLVSTIGKGLQVKTGTNAKIGTAVLVGGTKTVANTSVTANSRIFLSDSTPGGTVGNLSYSKSVGVSFTITSTNVLDTSTIDWFIVESIP